MNRNLGIQRMCLCVLHVLTILMNQITVSALCLSLCSFSQQSVSDEQMNDENIKEI